MTPNFKPSELITLPDDAHHHHHDHHQVVIGLSGRAQFDLSGKQKRIGPAQGCLVYAEAEHEFVGLGQNKMLILNVQLNESLGQKTLQQVSGLFEQNPFFQLSHSSHQLTELLGNQIAQYPNDPLLNQACTDTVICLLRQHWPDQGPERSMSRLNMDVLDAYIDAHLERKISVAQLAGRVFLGESQFHALFKQQNNVTPYQYVLKKRLSKALSLLEVGQHSLSDIAHRAGFANQSAFTHAFSKHYRVSPSKYLK